MLSLLACFGVANTLAQESGSLGQKPEAHQDHGRLSDHALDKITYDDVKRDPQNWRCVPDVRANWVKCD